MHVAIKAWFDSQLAEDGALVALAAAPYTAIWGYQNGPKAPHPYATLSWSRAFASVGGKVAVTNAGTDDEPIERREYDAEGRLRVELLSRAALDPDSGLDETMALITGLEASIRTSLQIEAFTAAGVEFIDTTPPIAIPFVVGFSQERRAQFDVIFRARVRVDASSGYVLDSGSINRVSGAVDEDGVEIEIGTT